MTAFTLDDRYRRESGEVYLSGVQALVRVLFDRVRHDQRQGLTTSAFVSGYEGSPLGGFDLELARRKRLLDEYRVVHQPGLNEELAATSVQGSQLVARLGRRTDGVTGYWYGKAPGLDRATDALRHANLAGADPRGGAVAFVGDDPNAKSSTVPSASELALADLAIPVLFPADARDIVDFGRHAVELSRASGLWAAMKIVANVADAASTALVIPDWTPPTLPDTAYQHQPNARLLGADLVAMERSLHRVRLPLALEYLRASGLNRLVRRGAGDRVGIVVAGKSYLDVCQALRMLGVESGVRVLKLGAVFPLEPGIVREFADGLAEIVVVEEKRAFLEPAVKDVLYGMTDAPRVHGKSLFSELGELDPDLIARGLRKRLADFVELTPEPAKPRERISLPLLARTPYFCSGCPHNSSTKVPDGTIVGAGIGCHTMALFMDPESVGDVVGLTQMGGEGAQWIGMAPFVDAEHFVQNLGDGTFTHSGSLAIRASVAAGTNITYKLLYNSAVAMTGGQQPAGGLAVHTLAELLLREGVRKVVITSDQPRRIPRVAGVEVRHRDELLRTQEQLAKVPGVTVLIHEQECAAEKRRKRRRGTQPTPAAKVVINERVCEGCGDCGAKSNCLSVQPVETEFGRKTAIHQSSCNLDYSCLAGDCPSFLTVTPSGRRDRATAPDLAFDAVPEPVRKTGDIGVRITGIGGTGVVTVSQILATAAFLDGKQVRMLDQIGLAQKGGAVVSDIKITASGVEQAPKLAAGECDLYLACDSLVGADPVQLRAASPARTVAVVSTAEVPTGRMVADPGVSFPSESSIRDTIDTATAQAWYLDARGLAEELFDDDQFANILQVGAAYQTGALGLSAETIEQAITVNGTAVAANIQAFRRGRQAVADREGLERTLAGPASASASAARPGVPAGIRALVAAEPGSELARVLDLRLPDLVAYQSEAYAAEYARFVERVRQQAPEAAEAVARNLYKLMAYKDEYEVARLSLDPRLRAEIAERFGTGSRVSYRLHPPVLRAFGMRGKISLGPWFDSVFRVLRAGRRLRGTGLDPFGYTQVRRTERALIAEYRAAIEQAMASAPDHALVRELAELPDMVRGYEEIKLGNVARYRARQAEILTELRPVTPVPTAS